jgi:uncharacterized protein
MRTSSYVIYVRLPKSGEYLLMHGYTGAIDVVGKETADSLRFGWYDRLSGAAVAALKMRGYLTDAPITEERDYVRHFAAVLRHRESRSRNYAFIVAYDCNFRCAYCFENAISKDGQAWSGETFSEPLVDAAYRAIDRLSDGLKPSHTITLYGGEPLLRRNVWLVRYIVSQGVSWGYDFHAITNGYELDAFDDLIGSKFINHLQITIDGNEKDHDQRRSLHTGEGSFLKIFSNVTLALRLGAKVSLRVNVDESNVDGLEELAAKILEAGWLSSRKFKCHISYTQSCSTAPAWVGRGNSPDSRLVDGQSTGSTSSFRKDNPRRLECERDEGGKFSVFILPGDALKDHLKAVIRSRKGVEFRGSYCGASTGNVIFDPRGDIYACWESVGDVSHRTGRFFPALDVDSEMIAHWRNRSVAALEPCSKCKYALLCGGGCAVFAGRKFGNMDRPFCDGFPALFHVAARRAYEEEIMEGR